MLILSPRFFRFVRSLLVFLALSTGPLVASDFKAPEEQLARKIASVTGPGAIAMEFSNRSTLPKSNFDTVRRELLTELASLGLHFVPAEQAAVTVRFSLSEDLQSYVWVAEIIQGTNAPAIRMVTSPRDDSAFSARPAVSMTLRKTPLWSQQVRILDAAVIEGNPSHLIVLDTEKIVAYRYQADHWQAEQSFPIVHSHPWPRDARGRLVLRRDHLLDAYLPGLFCQSSAGSPLALACRPSDDPWPLGGEQSAVNAFFATTRNYFTGALAPGIGKLATTAPFYSAAILPHDKYTLGVFAGVDGQVHLLDGITDRIAGKSGWGSNLATIRSPCGSGWQVVASGDGLGPSDAIGAYEFPDREPVPMSQALEFPGPVTELWTESPGTSAVAIVRDFQTGQYEAFRITVACNQ
ncbi:MAG TPA: hypothetical protein VFA68_13760 [Terriglobales bacterium]|nr:hypothetical protein [Terriglobales bacterium]